MHAVSRSLSVSETDARSAFATALDRRAREIAAVKDARLIVINIDVGQAVTTVLGAVSKIDTLRPAIARLEGVDQHAIDGLGDYAMATAQASVRHTAAISRRIDTALHDEALRLRDLLRIDANALARRRLVDAKCLAAIRRTRGSQNIAYELMCLTQLLANAWPQIHDKTACSADELNHAKGAAEQLVRAAAEAAHARAAVKRAARVRQQAFTLMVNAYAEARRAVAFLRWHEHDVDRILPSLYCSRVRRTGA